MNEKKKKYQKSNTYSLPAENNEFWVAGVVLAAELAFPDDDSTGHGKSSRLIRRKLKEEFVARGIMNENGAFDPAQMIALFDELEKKRGPIFDEIKAKIKKAKTAA